MQNPHGGRGQPKDAIRAGVLPYHPPTKKKKSHPPAADSKTMPGKKGKKKKKATGGVAPTPGWPRAKGPKNFGKRRTISNWGEPPPQTPGNGAIKTFRQTNSKTTRIHPSPGETKKMTITGTLLKGGKHNTR